ncbi:MAG: site-2 protease family protein [Deltaproteobacteria bacterium]|nr:site-2 protease family protein [Deltaproteobacteria bacterium]
MALPDLAQPAPPPDAAAAPVFYAVDTVRLSWRELWWWTRSPRVVFAYLNRLLRRRMMCSVDDPPVATLRPFAVDEAQVPEDVRTALAPPLHELEQLGFRDPAWHRIEDDLLHTDTLRATLHHPSGEAFARLQHRRWSFVTPPRVTQFVDFVSAYDDGRFLWTVGTRRGIEPTPGCDDVHVADATPAALWAVHAERLRRQRFARAVSPLRTPQAVADAAERLHARVLDRMLARGLYRPRNPDDVRRAAALTARRAPASGGDERHADVLAEIDRLEQPQHSWRKAALVLLVSAALFLAGGAWQWSLEFTALLVPVLLFHELGHWVAMRAFRYRNLRMFFIPFFGAAVSGRHYNVPGWKKVVVSLMGPLPGIVVGALLAGVALATGSDLARRLALVLVIVNGFNLAPVLPLDGGWVVRALVFARHHLLDVLFSLLAGAALLRFGVAGDAPIFLMLGMIFLMSALTTYRSGLIVRDLRAAALPPLPSDDDRIPPPTAAVIIDRVRATWPKANARTTAQHTLRIFEALNARPPGWLASLGLGAAYVGGIALAAVTLLGLATYGFTATRYLLRPYLEPRGTVDSAAVIAPPAAAFPADGEALLIATYGDSEQARAAHAALGADPNGAPAALFGQSVIVSTPTGAARRALAARLPGAPDLLRPKHNYAVEVSLTCHTADPASAAALQQTLERFFALPTSQLIPPWADPDPRSAAQRAQHDRARDTYRQINTHLYGTPAMDALDVELDDAYERHDDAAVSAIVARMEELELDAQHRAIAELQSGGAAETDGELAAAYAAALIADESASMSSDVWGPVMARLGTLTDASEAPQPRTRQEAFGGTPTAHDTLVRVDDARFADVVHGPAALSAWLQAAGCGDQHYAFED